MSSKYVRTFWAPFGSLRESRRKSAEVAETFPEISPVMRSKSNVFDSEKVGR